MWKPSQSGSQALILDCLLFRRGITQVATRWYERPVVSPTAAVCRWSLLLLSPLLSGIFRRLAAGNCHPTLPTVKRRDYPGSLFRRGTCWMAHPRLWRPGAGWLLMEGETRG
jgi:hypothetical protein